MEAVVVVGMAGQTHNIEAGARGLDQGRELSSNEVPYLRLEKLKKCLKRQGSVSKKTVIMVRA